MADERRILTEEMRVALHAFARKHGRNWKAALRDLWMRGKDEGALRQVRNAIGPLGLDRIREADLEPSVLDCELPAKLVAVHKLTDARLAALHHARRAGWDAADRVLEKEGREKYHGNIWKLEQLAAVEPRDAWTVDYVAGYRGRGNGDLRP